MATFRFRYERLLRLALQRERMQAFTLARKMAEVVAQKGKIEETQREWDRARREWLNQAERGASAAELASRSQWLEVLQRRLEADRERLKQLQRELEEERKKLVELVKKRRTYEKLEQKERMRFEERQRKLEQARLDEIAGIADWRDKTGEKR